MNGKTVAKIGDGFSYIDSLFWFATSKFWIRDLEQEIETIKKN